MTYALLCILSRFHFRFHHFLISFAVLTLILSCFVCFFFFTCNLDGLNVFFRATTCCCYCCWFLESISSYNLNSWSDKFCSHIPRSSRCCRIEGYTMKKTLAAWSATSDVVGLNGFGHINHDFDQPSSSITFDSSSLLTGFSGLFVAKIGLTGLGKPLAIAVAETPTLLFSGFTERGQCQWKTEPSTDRLSSRPHFCIPI